MVIASARSILLITYSYVSVAMACGALRNTLRRSVNAGKRGPLGSRIQALQS